MRRLCLLFMLIFCLRMAYSENNALECNQYDLQGRKDGLWIEKFAENFVQYTYYSHGVEHGIERGFNPLTSQLEYIGEVNQGAMAGTWYYSYNGDYIYMKCDDFRDTATLIPIVHNFVTKYAPHNCHCVCYYSNGKIQEEGRLFFFTTPRMDDSGEYGTWKYYDEDGNLVKTVVYE